MLRFWVSGNETQVRSYDVFGQPTVKRREDRFADGSAVAKDVVVPEPERGVAEGTEVFVAATIVVAFGVLRAVDLDDERVLPTTEVREIWSYRELARELVATEFAAFEFEPEQRFGLVVTSTQISRACGRARLSASSCGSSAFPHSVAASRRHLSPLRRERKGARHCGRRFLSPVDRGRGGRRSRSEWGSTGDHHESVRNTRPLQKSVGAPPSAVRRATKASISSSIPGSIGGFSQAARRSFQTRLAFSIAVGEPASDQVS